MDPLVFLVMLLSLIISAATAYASGNAGAVAYVVGIALTVLGTVGVVGCFAFVLFFFIVLSQ